MKMVKHAQDNSDSHSSYSEDEMRIEAEIRRHNSEDEIDHGPVLQSLRTTRQEEQMFDEEAKRIAKELKKKEKDNATN